MTTVAIVGFGSRGVIYTNFSQMSAGRFQVVAAVDTNPAALKRANEEFGIKKDMLFDCLEAFMARGKIADCVCICTQDRQHYRHTMAALDAGYDILLEKPISPDARECIEIADRANKLGRQVTVAHVLRYSPFYQKLRELISSGVLGDIVNIVQIENVGLMHHVHSYVRGNWKDSKKSAPMILAKCCHDLDLILYLSGKKCLSLNSFGALSYFTPKNAPAGCADRCLDGCKYQDSCLYDAERVYIKDRVSGNNGWFAYYIHPQPTVENLYAGLKTGGYGRCAYKAGNDVVDHQTVNFNLEGGATAMLVMHAFAQRCHRQTKISGTKGEAYGILEDNVITLDRFGKQSERIDLSAFTDDFSNHGGGDRRLMDDFIRVVSGEKKDAKGDTDIDKSIESHIMAAAAEYSRVNGGVLVDLEAFKKTI
jgi:predicted dehydrogenase